MLARIPIKQQTGAQRSGHALERRGNEASRSPKPNGSPTKWVPFGRGGPASAAGSAGRAFLSRPAIAGIFQVFALARIPLKNHRAIQRSDCAVERRGNEAIRFPKPNGSPAERVPFGGGRLAGIFQVFALARIPDIPATRTNRRKPRFSPGLPPQKREGKISHAKGHTNSRG